MNTKKQNETEQNYRTYYHTKEVSNICVICNTAFVNTRKSRCCSERCRQIRRSNLKYLGIEGYDYITCPLCEQRVQQITIKHAQSHGFTTTEEMKIKNNMLTITCDKLKEKSQGENNPGYQHGGKFSKFSKNFIHGYDVDWHKEQIEKFKTDKQENPEKYPNRIEYWIKKAKGDNVEAERLYKKWQTRDLSFFVDKYGKEEGIKRHRLKTAKWVNSMPRYNYSKISQELFSKVLELYDTNHLHIYYATYDRENMVNYENKEYRLSVENTYVMPDFIDLQKKKIIEFDGDYWHSEAVANPEREKLRNERIIKEGYEILHVSEYDYRQNKEKVIQECLDFLNS